MSANTPGIPLKPVWFITGCSTGFGRELAKYLLNMGYRVVITARKLDKITDLNSEIKHGAIAEFLELDVTNKAQVITAIHTAETKFGQIDVLVNNAGIGYFAAVEESEEDEVRKMFEINIVGLSRMIKAVLPGMRKLRKGMIVNISSLAGIRSFPSLGFYSATKFAVLGLSEALWQEVEPLGINVMVVEPSGFRTDWAGRSADESKQQISDYEQTAGKSRKMMREMSGHQPGDPTLAVKAIVKAVESLHPPHHLLLGNDAVEGAKAQLKTLKSEYSAWEVVSRGADFPEHLEAQSSKH